MVKTPNFQLSFSENEVLKQLQSADDPYEAFMRASGYSHAWLVSKIFRNRQGLPLRLLPFQSVMLKMLWRKKFPLVMISRGGGKTFMFAVYACLKALLDPSAKIVIVGAAFRQSKICFNYIEELYNQSPIFQEACKHPPRKSTDACQLSIGASSSILAIPLGDGSKIRGLRSTCTICDEFNSVPEQIFEVVVGPFGSVHADPEKVARVSAFAERLKSIGINKDIIDELTSDEVVGNQIIIGGTAGHEFEPLFHKWDFYNTVIASRGDTNILKRALYKNAERSGRPIKNIKDSEIDTLSKMWKQYSILRIPYKGLPTGFLDDDMVSSFRANYSEARFDMEFNVIFTVDTNGFFKRSEINNATKPDDNSYHIELFGQPGAIYVMGLDPARQNDYFGLVVLKIIGNTACPVYVDAWQKTDTVKSIRKIREVMRKFNIVHISMDAGSGGGGTNYADLLASRDLLQEGDAPIFQIDDEEHAHAPGLHILELVNPTTAKISELNYGLHADIQHKRIIFPNNINDDILYSQYKRYHKIDNELKPDDLDWIEKQVYGDESDITLMKVQHGIWGNYNEMVDEVCAIERTVTPAGTERFDLPTLEAQIEGLDKRHRDRYSAFLLAAYSARVVLQRSTYRPQMFPGGTPQGILSRTRRSSVAKFRGNVAHY